MYLPGFVCGTSGLGDALGLEETRRLSFGPVKMSKVLNLLLRMMIQHKSFDFPDTKFIFCKEFFRKYFFHLKIITKRSPVNAINIMLGQRLKTK